MRPACLHIVAVIALGASPAYAASSSPRTVSFEDAQAIVMAEMIHEHRSKLPGLALTDASEAGEPSFWIISADWNGTGINGHYGFFAVDRVTADLWEVVSCGSYHSPEVQRAQKRVRWRLGLNDREYRRLRRSGPLCYDEPPPKHG
jgi:hypothetical protein